MVFLLSPISSSLLSMPAKGIFILCSSLPWNNLSFTSSGIVDRNHKGFCDGMNAFWIPAVIPQNGLVVLGRGGLEILG